MLLLWYYIHNTVDYYFFPKMPKKLKERIFRYFFLQNTEKETEELKKELTETLREIVLKKGFIFFEILLLLLILSIILNIVQYFLSK
jgi:hypothetical protein